MDKEKQEWMKEVGIKELRITPKYYFVAHNRAMHYTEDYINNTPLAELQEGTYEALNTLIV